MLGDVQYINIKGSPPCPSESHTETGSCPGMGFLFVRFYFSIPHWSLHICPKCFTNKVWQLVEQIYTIVLSFHIISVAPVIGGLQHPVSVCCVLLIFVFLLIHSRNNFYKFGFSGRASYSYIPHIPKLLHSMF